LITKHGNKLLEGLKTALRRHRDLLIRVLRELDSSPARFSLGSLDPFGGAEGAKKGDAKGAVSSAGSSSTVRESFERVGAGLVTPLERLCGHRDPEVRALALSVLVKIGPSSASKQITEALRDESSTVVRSAIEAAVRFARRGGSGSAARRTKIIGLLAARLPKLSWMEKRDALRALGALEAKGAWRLVADHLAAENGFVAEAAAKALGEMGDERGVEPLCKALEHGIEPVRFAAARSLGKLSTPKARAALRKAAKDDTSPRVRSRAARSLKM
jgi:HEAT repeat protein